MGEREWIEMNDHVGPKLPPTVTIDFDRPQVFLLYATFCGDVERTALAAGLNAVDILRVADEEGWALKLEPILKLKRSTRPGDFERAMNRALNYVQAHRMRLFLERIVAKVTGMNEAEVQEYLFTDKTMAKDGVLTVSKKLSTRPLADLTSALEKCHAMTYLALNDTVQDRTRRQEQTKDDGLSAGDLHAQIVAAMAEKGASTSPRAQLLDAQLKVAKSIKPPEDDTMEREEH